MSKNQLRDLSQCVYSWRDRIWTFRPPEKLIVRTDSYQRRHVSPPPPPRRGPSPPSKSSGGRSEANDRFAAARGGLSGRDFDDRDRRDGPRFNAHGDSFRSGERLAPVEFGRRDGGRGMFHVL